MLLPPADVQLYFRLNRALMFFVNQRLQVVPGDLAKREEYAALPLEARFKLRDALLSHIDLVESFVAENPSQLPDAELDIVRS